MMTPPAAISPADLHGLVDGEIGRARAAAVLAHLADHAEDAARVEGWRAQNEALRSTFGAVAREPLPLSLCLSQPPERVAAAPEAGNVSHLASLPPIGPAQDPIRQLRASSVARAPLADKSLLVPVGTFVAGLIVATGLTMALRHGPETAVTSKYQAVSQDVTGALNHDASQRMALRAQAAYRTYADDPARAVEMAAGPALLPWLSQRSGLEVRLPDFSAEKITLLGGRIIPGEFGPAAFALYKNAAGERISLYVERAGLFGDTAFKRSSGGAVRSIYWRQKGAIHVLTTGVDTPMLGRMAERAMREMQ